jgi:hypothetical protein
MAFKRSAAQKLTDVLTIDIDGLGELNITYKTTGHSYGTAIASSDRLAAAKSEAEKREISVSTLLELVTEWDVLEDDNVTPCPIKLEVLNDLPAAGVNKLVMKLIEKLKLQQVPEANGQVSSEQ